MKYQLIDHTADVGIQVFGADINVLFENAAAALFDVITDPDKLKGAARQTLSMEGADWPDLMVNWLREHLYLWAGQEKLVKESRILSISEYKLTAVITYDPYRSDRHLIKEEIKAVTYHQIDVHQGSTGWEARVIFDV